MPLIHCINLKNGSFIYDLNKKHLLKHKIQITTRRFTPRIVNKWNKLKTVKR